MGINVKLRLLYGEAINNEQLIQELEPHAAPHTGTHVNPLGPAYQFKTP